MGHNTSVLLRQAGGESVLDDALAARVVNYIQHYTGMYYHSFPF